MNLQGLRNKWPALLRFAAGGVLSAGVTLSVTAVLHEVFAVPEPKAAAIAMLAALSVNYVFLRYVAFRGTHIPWQRQLVLFFLRRVSSAGSSTSRSWRSTYGWESTTWWRSWA